MDRFDYVVWQDREVKFDISNVQHKIRGGEEILDIFDYVEDTKGNPNERGRLLVTNLRLIWYSLNNNKFNLSIGFNCILTITLKSVLSKLRGTTLALYILTLCRNSRFEFIFTNLAQSNTRKFSSVLDVHRSYESTVLYRELKLRSAIMSSGHLILLPKEQVYSTFGGIWNLSSDQGNLGTLIVTNVRVIWYADINETFNISLPHMQIASIKIRDSKYGHALVIQTLETGGGYTLGFRVDPAARLVDVYKELDSLFSVYSATPIFGVTYERKEEAPERDDDTISIDKITEVDESKTDEINTKFSTYLADGTDNGRRPPFYCKELGFAMEKIKDGFTLKDLWEVIPTTN
ncbi:Bardet-Biedl syndrome 5 protein homolog [Contarinia nasturtii]|uniref:Bardet-Biedl syndrome 5 protein homolog n=1 Tax=Contarinia nasturtii TaxID=265458 RepID=UPI0012D430CF|nr:Bardet-Biedl syndrome 5 protein homolog [Contarinia nasturtii]